LLWMFCWWVFLYLGWNLLSWTIQWLLTLTYWLKITLLIPSHHLIPSAFKQWMCNIRLKLGRGVLLTLKDSVCEWKISWMIFRFQYHWIVFRFFSLLLFVINRMSLMRRYHLDWSVALHLLFHLIGFYR
jgi:hypothetical protein